MPIGDHQPVLLLEAVEGLAIRPEGIYADVTFGRGGHSRAILARLGDRGRLLAMDKDPEAIEAARAELADPRVCFVHGSFAMLKQSTDRLNLSGRIDGVLFDLGVSSPQLDDPRRGFSFLRDGPLGMRMDSGTGITAAQWLAAADESEIARVLKDYGEERHARRIARAIIDRRRATPIETTGQLAALIAAASPSRERHKHPATRSFQALRIYINRELEALQAGLAQALAVLAPGGRLAAISFHSLEDRVVKRFIREHSRAPALPRGLPLRGGGEPGALRPVGRAIRPSAAECRRNPRARSATLRVAERSA